MTEIVNTAQSDAWNGYEGEHWASNVDRYDAVNSGFNSPVLDAAGIGRDDRVLDVGCGNGQLTRLAARRAASATGLDLSGPMLATARSRAEQVANVSFTQGDAQVFPFEPGSFDVVISRFGIMFFADPVAAFANLRHALSPSGRLAFVCMTALTGTDLGEIFDALSPYLPRPTGADGTGPTSFADPDRTRSVLGAAGFRDIGCERITADQVWGRDLADATDFLAASGPVRYHLGQVDADTATRARAALTEALRPFAGADVRLRGHAWLVTAHA